jgi:hypothetical protein
MARVNGSGEWIGGRKKKKVHALYCLRPLVPAGVTSDALVAGRVTSRDAARNTSRDQRPGAIIAGWSRWEPPLVTVRNTNRD